MNQPTNVTSEAGVFTYTDWDWPALSDRVCRLAMNGNEVMHFHLLNEFENLAGLTSMTLRHDFYPGQKQHKYEMNESHQRTESATR